MMIEQLKQAFALAERRPEQEQQAIADLILAEMESEERWEVLFADRRSETLLNRLVAEAAAEDAAGDSEEMTDEAFL